MERSQTWGVVNSDIPSDHILNVYRLILRVVINENNFKRHPVLRQIVCDVRNLELTTNEIITRTDDRIYCSHCEAYLVVAEDNERNSRGGLEMRHWQVRDEERREP